MRPSERHRNDLTQICTQTGLPWDLWTGHLSHLIKPGDGLGMRRCDHLAPCCTSRIPSSDSAVGTLLTKREALCQHTERAASPDQPAVCAPIAEEHGSGGSAPCSLTVSPAHHHCRIWYTSSLHRDLSKLVAQDLRLHTLERSSSSMHQHVLLDNLCPRCPGCGCCLETSGKCLFQAKARQQRATLQNTLLITCTVS